MKRFALIVAALGAALAAITLLLLPEAAPPAVVNDIPPAWPTARGAYHVHSERSDGTGTLDEIAAAGARAGLQFIIFTDHGDGTRVPEPPAYRSGVLCLDGVEISTDHGHYVAIGLSRTPYPLAGHPRDVIADVRRFGGFGIAAHPGSPKAELRWDAWDAPFDGLEWLNADSEWRDEFWGSLGAVLLTYTWRPVETLAGLLDRPEAVLQQWDRVALTRRVPGLAGADAHARLGFGQRVDPYEDRVLARVPGYEVSFRAFVNHVILDRGLTGDAAYDAALILAGIREGRLFTSIDGLAGFAGFEARASSGSAIARPGEYLDLHGPAAIDATIAAPADTTLAVVRDGQRLYETRERALRLDVGTAPGAYRIEAYLPPELAGTSVPWVLTNPIYVGLREAHARARITGATPPATSRSAISTLDWEPEASEGSTSVLRAAVLGDGTPAVEWQFTIAGGTRDAQYAAMRFSIDGRLAGHDRLQLRARSDAPRRVWAQLRAPGPGDGERWGTSFYLDDALAAVELFFGDFRSLGPVASERPPLDRVDSLLLVIDTVNSVPGTTGQIAITDLWLAR
ncbi:MAG TPA: CehA/McbA family metallohydrolase [Vicinamibacterales bacterium]|nr:CehA/McbA family metallohydrolase [Vicinamibacterales bacterium]